MEVTGRPIGTIVRGAVVEDVTPGSPAEQAGLRRRDIILRIQNRAVANAGSVLATVGLSTPGTELAVDYLRGGRSASTRMSVAEAPADENEDQPTTPTT